jgi:hypothetical protein
MFKLFFSDDKQSLLSASMRLEDTPEWQNQTRGIPTLIFETPPDISLPIANPAPLGADETTRRIQMLELGRLYAIPYSSHPLFMESASPPVLILQSSMQTFVQESVTSI